MPRSSSSWISSLARSSSPSSEASSNGASGVASDPAPAAGPGGCGEDALFECSVKSCCCRNSAWTAWRCSEPRAARTCASACRSNASGTSPLTSLLSFLVRSKTALSCWGRRTNSARAALDCCCAWRRLVRLRSWHSALRGMQLRASSSSSSRSESTCVTTVRSGWPRSSSHCLLRSLSRPRSRLSTAMMFSVRPRRTGARLSRSCLICGLSSGCAQALPGTRDGAGVEGGGTLPERGEQSTGVRHCGEPGMSCWPIAMSCLSSLTNCDMRAVALAGWTALPRPLLWPPLPLTIWKLPRPGDVSREDGLLSLSAVDSAPLCPGVQGVEHSPSPGLSSSFPSSSLFCCSSTPASPEG
mmetsp:Transcript_93560/g.209486  ORF Transcript_93560/g.209486 Transcript_93560/m.209486 type:complete len:356 (-) Transcript_93560:788-1855(-)